MATTVKLNLPVKTLVVPVGLPGSGKSTLLREVDADGWSIGGDDVRKLVFGTVKTQGDPGKVHAAVRALMEIRMVRGLPVACDSTNLTRKNRKVLLDLARRYGYTTVALESQVSVDEVLKRNAHRARFNADAVVPEDIIRKMVDQFEPVSLEEGFDDIQFFDANTLWLEIDWED